MMHLRTYDLNPPTMIAGGPYFYDQSFKGKNYRFGPAPHIESVAAALASFRAGNGLPRASKLEALQDVDASTCVRMSDIDQTRWCVDTETPGVALSANHPMFEPCKGCGATV